MTPRFIKYIPSEFSSWLRSRFPKAYLLLSLIAERARRDNDSLDGFLIGDALLGDHEEAGLTRKEYRNALIKLEELNVIEILKKSKNGSTCEKRAIKKAIKGTVVNLRDSSIWDINPNIKGHQIGHQGAIKGPSKGHEEECKERYKNDKKLNTPPNPQIPESASADGVRVENPQPRKIKTPKQRIEKISQAAQDLFPQFIAIIKLSKPNYVVKNELNILESLDEMLSEGRLAEDILRVLEWAVRDNKIRGAWDGWSSKVICKNPAAYLANRFDQIEMASKAKKERKFSPSSDDNEALKKIQSMREYAL